MLCYTPEDSYEIHLLHTLIHWTPWHLVLIRKILWSPEPLYIGFLEHDRDRGCGNGFMTGSILLQLQFTFGVKLHQSAKGPGFTTL